jgi:murein tripeptide amidase MpaA
MTRATSELHYDHFPNHAELTSLVDAWAKEAPELIQVESIGKSWQGRDIWMLTLTNFESGDPSDKPALLVEGNIHAAELASSVAALHCVRHLLEAYGSDEQVTRLLDTRCIYVVPRLCPDGAEVVMTEARYVRSSVRPHPSPEREPGLHERDIDGDGRVLFMRVPDQDGPWKCSEKESRLLVRRRPDEYGGEYFRLYVEGEVDSYDGLTVPIAQPYEGLDLAANFHSDWSDLPRRSVGAGGFAGSEPEIQALIRAVDDRPNITAYVSCHTFGAVHLHPPLNDDDVVPSGDAAAFAELGAMASERTGYQAMSYNDLKHAPYRVKGGQLSWFYHERGVLAWITEFWNPLRAAGVDTFHPARWLVDHPEEDDLTLIRWSDEELGGRGFVDWYPFEHPQLGAVELGGWDLINYWYNPPFDQLETEVAPHTDWLVSLGLTLPRLAIREHRLLRLAPDTYSVRVAVSNTGWLPTTGTRKAADRTQCGPIVLTIDSSEHATVIAGGGPVDLGQLEGRVNARTTTTWWGHDPGTPDIAIHEILVRAEAGGSLDVTVRHPRAGTASATIRLPD